MGSNEGIELQHRGKTADASVQASDSSSGGQPSHIADNTESSKVHPRQLDVSGAIDLLQ